MRAELRRSDMVLLEPGEWVLTEWRGRFFAVGFVDIVAGGEVGARRQARCCDDGHPTEVGVEECWESSP
jgi:hypothetical protein